MQKRHRRCQPTSWLTGRFSLVHRRKVSRYWPWLCKDDGHRAGELRFTIGGWGYHPATSERRGIDYKSDRERPWSFRSDAGPRGSMEFKTPGLRHVAQTRPYMHDGSIATLREVVDYFDRGGDYSPNKSELIKPLHLSEQEKRDLVAFLESLTGTHR